MDKRMPGSAESSSIDWDDVREETTKHLQHLIRCNTVNPPGNETAAAEYLRTVLEAEGIEARVFEPAPGRGNLYARLRGSGEKRPLLLLSHIDTVPVEAAKWRVPPFSGEIEDGCVWGRGAVDNKGMTAIELMAMLLLKRQGVALRRDVILLAVADEEMGGRLGVVWTLENHSELVDCEFALNEFGGEAIDFGNRRLYLCQVAEKGAAGMKIRAEGKPGHASVPTDTNAVIKLGEALAKVKARGMPVHVIKTLRVLIEEIAEGYQGKERENVLALLDPGRTNEALKQFPVPWLAETMSALLRNGATPTVLRVGEKSNVIPSEAEAILDCRGLPGYDADDVLAELRALLVGQDVKIEATRPGARPLSYELGTANELYTAIVDTIAGLDPGARVAPYLYSGFTDSRYLIPRGTIAYGFGPIMRAEDGVSSQLLAHAHDERIPLNSLGFGSRVIYEIARRVCEATHNGLQ